MNGSQFTSTSSFYSLQQQIHATELSTKTYSQLHGQNNPGSSATSMWLHFESNHREQLLHVCNSETVASLVDHLAWTLQPKTLKATTTHSLVQQ